MDRETRFMVANLVTKKRELGDVEEQAATRSRKTGIPDY
jgi:hypothetical protein